MMKSKTLHISLAMLIVGGMVMVQAQEKPPLLGGSPNVGYSQPAAASPPVAQPAPPQPIGQAVPPPPAGQTMPQPLGGAGIPLSNASLAVATAQKVKEFLTPGKIWTMTGPRGEVEIKAAILYEGAVVAVVRFNPVDGSVLPLGLHPVVSATAAQIENIKREFPIIIRALEILNGAEYREPENVWAVPLAYKDMIVSHLKIYVDGIHVVPDYPANQEMQLYAR